MSEVILNEAAITRFFETPGGAVEALLRVHGEHVRTAAIADAKVVMQGRFDPSGIMEVRTEEGPLRVEVGIFSAGRLVDKAHRDGRDNNWLTRAVEAARSPSA